MDYIVFYDDNSEYYNIDIYAKKLMDNFINKEEISYSNSTDLI